MPKFFIDMRVDGYTAVDEEGHPVSGIDHAAEIAHQSMLELASEKLTLDHPIELFAMVRYADQSVYHAKLTVTCTVDVLEGPKRPLLAKDVKN